MRDDRDILVVQDERRTFALRRPHGELILVQREPGRFRVVGAVSGALKVWPAGTGGWLVAGELPARHPAAAATSVRLTTGGTQYVATCAAGAWLLALPDEAGRDVAIASWLDASNREVARSELPPLSGLVDTGGRSYAPIRN